MRLHATVSDVRRASTWLPGLLGGAALAFAAEAVLARATGFPLAFRDLAIAAGAAALLAIGGGSVVALLPLGAAARQLALGAAAALPVALVASGIPYYALVPGPARLGVAGALGLASLALGAAVALARHTARLPVAAVLAPIAVAAAVTWVLGGGGLPSTRALAGVAIGWIAMAAIGSLPRSQAKSPSPLAVESGRLLAALAAGAFALLSPLRFSGAPVAWIATNAAPEAPDILLLSVDTLRADAAGEMEVHARLARDGAVFREVQSAAPWTLPALATLHTGLPVSGHGAGLSILGSSGIRASAPTLAERLAAAGYDTAAVVARNGFAGRGFGFDRGFAVFDYGCDVVARAALPRNQATCAVRPVAVHALLSFVPPGAVRRVASRLGLPLVDGAEGVVERALSVAARRRDRPLFLWLHFIDPHRPYRHVAGSDVPGELREKLASLSVKELRADPVWRTPAGRDALWAAYRHEIRVLDRELVRLLDALGPPRANGRITVFTADHGEEFLEHGGLEHGHTLYQELLAVPLVIEGAGAGTHGSVAGLVDVAPTLLAAAGLPRDGLPGRDLFGPEAAAATYVSRNLLYGDAPEDVVGVRRGPWKVIASPTQTALYELETDPHERRNRSAELPELARELGASGVGEAALGPAVPMDAQDVEALRELGYVH